MIRASRRSKSAHRPQLAVFLTREYQDDYYFWEVSLLPPALCSSLGHPP